VCFVDGVYGAIHGCGWCGGKKSRQTDLHDSLRRIPLLLPQGHRVCSGNAAKEYRVRRLNFGKVVETCQVVPDVIVYGLLFAVCYGESSQLAGNFTNHGRSLLIDARRRGACSNDGPNLIVNLVICSYARSTKESPCWGGMKRHRVGVGTGRMREPRATPQRRSTGKGALPYREAPEADESEARLDPETRMSLPSPCRQRRASQTRGPAFRARIWCWREGKGV